MRTAVAIYFLSLRLLLAAHARGHFTQGAGKTTFLKLLEGELIPTEGWVSRHTKLRIAKFTQHHLEMMVPGENAVDHMRKLEHEMPIETARKYLGQFGLQGDNALKPVRLLSGGQRSRLAFAQLAWRQPHVLLLDEPTNHLDLETIEALAFALNDFGGGVVLVSHDERLISLVCDEIWSVNPGNPGSVTIYHGRYEWCTHFSARPAMMWELTCVDISCRVRFAALLITRMKLLEDWSKSNLHDI